MTATPAASAAASTAAPVQTDSAASLNPVAQLRAGRLTRRLPQLYGGLVLYGISMGLMIRSRLGLDPWDVLHYGLTKHLSLSFGTVVILVGFAVLLAWIPLRQWPGLGTISNALVIGLVTDVALGVLTSPHALWLRITFLAVGIASNGLATALYIGARFGPGPRDGLMTGLVRRTGWSVRVVRTSIEVTVLAVGWLLGGLVGVGTVAYALGIGPIVHYLLPFFDVPSRPSAAVDRPGT